MALEATELTELCLRLQEESNKSKFYSYRNRISVLIIRHITFRVVACQPFSK